jgi:DsbC/DsbD-like thiol-disulfide interchange protein
MLRCVLFCLLTIAAHAQVFEGKTLVKASLLADTTAIVPGKPFEVGVLLEMAPGWHTYWEYPGDAGLPTSISWTLPEGFVAGPIQWPLPHRVLEPGDIEVYAYKDRVLLLTAIVAPAKIPETTVTIQAGLCGNLHSGIGEPGIVSSRSRSVRTNKRGALRRISRDPSRSHSTSILA